jgi:anti-sigma factor RsiW
MSLELDDRLPAAASGRLEAHVRECLECRRQWELLLAARADLPEASRITASPGFADRVMAALEREVVFPWMEALPLVRGLAAAGLALCLVTGSLLFLRLPAGTSGAPTLPMGKLDPMARQLFETGSVPPMMHPTARPLGVPAPEGK